MKACYCKSTIINISETGMRIREAMQRKNISASELAHLLGISNQSVYKWINGQSLPTLENMVQLANIFGETVDRLTVTEDTMRFECPEIYLREDSYGKLYNH